MFLSLLAIGICLTLSAIFSGLTLGLMSLDLMGLQIVIESGTRKEASEQERKDGQLAQKILPFRKRGNLLLCTLLLGNVAVNCILSILMADLTSGLAGFLISTLSIVIFGEIVPQSVCSRHPLYIGEDMGTVYNRNQIKGMLSMYSKMKETDMGHEETTIMAGVVDFQAKQVGDCMTAIQDVFMIDIDDHLNFDLILRIFQSGHSRIPVYQMNPNHANSFHPKEVIGLLFAKELVLVDPEDCLPVRTICHHWFGRDVPIFYSDSKLTTVMNEFKSGRSHMALVKEVVDNTDGDPFYSTVGIITLEDLLEEILQQEIYDEKDINPNSSRKMKKHHMAAGGGAMSADHPLLLYLEAKERKESLLPPEEVSAISSFLRDKFADVFGEAVMRRASLEALIAASSTRKILKGEVVKEALYEAGKLSDTFTLVLDGNVDVVAGEDGFMCARGPWSSFGERILSSRRALTMDFTASVNSTISLARLLHVELHTYLLHTIGGATATRRARHISPPRLAPRHVSHLSPAPSGKHVLVSNLQEQLRGASRESSPGGRSTPRGSTPRGSNRNTQGTPENTSAIRPGNPAIPELALSGAPPTLGFASFAELLFAGAGGGGDGGEWGSERAPSAAGSHAAAAAASDDEHQEASANL